MTWQKSIHRLEIELAYWRRHEQAGRMTRDEAVRVEELQTELESLKELEKRL